VRFLAVVPLALVSAIASADRLIDIPTATKILYDNFRYECRSDVASSGVFEHYLWLGIGKSFELDLRDVSPSDSQQKGTFDFAYDFIAAIPNTSPGISFGVQDGANTTADGRRYYFATTFRNQVDVIGGGSDLYLTLGAQFGKLNSPFVGVSMPLSPQFALLAEHSGYRLSAGFEIRPVKPVALRLVQRGSKPMLSLSVAARF